MKSKISFFNKGVFNNIVKRYWPAWALYAFAWLLAMPVELLSRVRGAFYPATSFVHHMEALSHEVTIIMAFVSAIIVATGVFSYMYKQRENSMVASLPVKRESVFGSAFLAGFLPFTAINIAVAILSLLTVAGHINAECINAVLIWLGTYTLEFIAFYGIACCIAMLTGNIVALPVLYVIFNFLAVAIEAIIRELVNVFVYGLGFSDNLITECLSPVVYMVGNTTTYFANSTAYYNDMTGAVCPQLRFEGWGTLIIYALVGIALTVCALLLYRRRRMECTGDVIAVPALKPVFKYGVAICAAISFGLLIFLIFGTDYNGAGHSAVNLIGMIISMAIGGAVGYFGADMLLKKSVHVFKNNWGGYAAVVAACVVLSLVCRFDVFGVGRYVPDADDIQSVKISGSYSDAILENEDAVNEVISLHKSIAANLNDIAKEANRVWGPEEDCYAILIEYTLKNGNVVARAYNISETRPEAKQYIELMESATVQNARCEVYSKFTADNIDASSISYYIAGDDWYGCELTAEQAYDLYKNGLEPDIKAGNITFGNYITSAYEPEPPTVWIEYCDMFNGSERYLEFNALVVPEATNTIQWFKDNLGADFSGEITEPIINEAMGESVEYVG